MEAGLRFRKVDLHIHTPASACFLDKDVSPKDIVEAAIAAGLDAIAITDHNTAAWVDRVKEAATSTGLTVFPGVEISLFEGFHIVALFDTDKDADHVESLLGAIKITPDMQGRTETLCKFGWTNVMQEIRELDGLVVLAHVDDYRGAFKELEGQPLIQLVNDGLYVAVETTTGDLPDGFQPNKFRRTPTCYQSSDNPDPDDHFKHSTRGLGTRYSWFKLDRTITLEGLRQCFTDASVRIRKMGELDETSCPKIVSLQASDGFLGLQDIRFHHGLNSLIGGKGVGKSLIVEFIRFALDQPSANPDIQSDHDLKLEKRLGSSNSVELVCELPSGAQYKIKKTYTGPKPPAILECTDLASGQLYGGSVSELFPILAYSQTEVIKIAEDEEAQLRLIDGFLDVRTFESRISAVESPLAQNGRLLAEAAKESDALPLCEQELNTIEAQIAEVDRSLGDGSEGAKLFSEFRALENKKQVLEAHGSYMSTLRAILAATLSQTERALPPGITAEQEADTLLFEEHLRAVGARDLLLAEIRAADAVLAAQVEASSASLAVWLPTFAAKEAEYREALTAEAYKKTLEEKRQSLLLQKKEAEERLATCRQVAHKLPSLEEEREKLLDELDSAYLAFFSARKATFDDLAAKSGKKLRLKLAHSANHKDFQDQLHALLKGSRARTEHIEAVAAKLMPRQFVALVRQRDYSALAGQTGISDNGSRTIIDRLCSGESLEPVLALQHSCYPLDVPSIKFRRDNREYAPLSELSVGQKCTALLIIALSEGTRPVIIDQPEDALDLTTVWEDVSQKLRAGKEKRQFILTTHNPSVAVASDSDMFVIVRSNAQRASVKCLGAIEVPDVKKAVIQHLEGGDEPYHLRLQKYNLRPRSTMPG